jgi:transitional endoplasmic reticulum ATPase
MDGIFSELRSNVFVIAVCQNIKMIDQAILRPGRIDVKIQISQPDRSTSVAILQKLIEKAPNEMDNEQVEWIIDRANIQCTADIIFLYRQAAMDAIRQSEILTFRIFENLIISSEPGTVA